MKGDDRSPNHRQLAQALKLVHFSDMGRPDMAYAPSRRRTIPIEVGEGGSHGPEWDGAQSRPDNDSPRHPVQPSTKAEGYTATKHGTPANPRVHPPLFVQSVATKHTPCTRPQQAALTCTSFNNEGQREPITADYLSFERTDSWLCYAFPANFLDAAASGILTYELPTTTVSLDHPPCPSRSVKRRSRPGF